MGDFILLPRRSQDATGSGNQAAAPIRELADALVHRVFGVGLVLQSAANMADGPVAERLAQAVDELDVIIHEVRAAALREASRPPA